MLQAIILLVSILYGYLTEDWLLAGFGGLLGILFGEALRLPIMLLSKYSEV